MRRAPCRRRRQRGEHRRIHAIIDEHAHRTAAGGERHRRRFKKILEEDQLVACFRIGRSQQFAVIAFGAENVATFMAGVASID